MTAPDLDQRVTLRIRATALQQIEALAALRGVSVSSCIRSMLEHFLSDDGGKAAEVERIRRISQRRPIRARRASRFRTNPPTEPPTRA
ncbi:hypothetical protein M2322_000630 [Rhodoblastus acidophilus]|uniref:hypothetical protein n=1 Tax=Rhodoblastus acidophilus TaxID=1074 RepID=UPI0022254462|nr:hypothetical protein [Rhodoblastus acidophilus]MCW2315110.1 hypothetical protein [Rhodoblastus acidophilus]